MAAPAPADGPARRTLTIPAGTRKIVALARAYGRRWASRITWGLRDAKASLIARYPRLIAVQPRAMLADLAEGQRRPLLAAAAVTAALAVLGAAALLVAPPPRAPDLARILGYDLAAVRTGAPVTPVYVKEAGTALRDVADDARRKRLFLRLMLPLILRENRDILAQRRRVRDSAPARIAGLYDRFGVEPGDAEALARRVDAVPPSLALAQAAIETGWGTSRFVAEANNFFGQRTYSDAHDGVVPADADGSFRVRRFATIARSIRSYVHNLNTHAAYAAFRRARARLRREGAPLTGLALAPYLTPYSERRQAYVRTVQHVIRRNRLQDFDDARLAAP